MALIVHIANLRNWLNNRNFSVKEWIGMYVFWPKKVNFVS